jgi:Tol biopolymer transport system component
MQMSKSGRQFTALGIIAALAVWCAPANANESVRAELTRLQKQKGLSLVALATAADPYGDAPRDRESIDTVVFGRGSLAVGRQILSPDTRISNNGSISPDGSEIALSTILARGNSKSVRILSILGRDGHLVRSYPCMEDGSDFCWSSDSSKLVLRAFDNRVDPCNRTLQVLDLKTGLTEKVDSNDDISVTSQCWSPDGKHFVYTSRHFNHREIRRYDEDEKTSVPLEGEGWGATWSPDGKWISFFVGDGEYAAGGTYYVVSPSGKGERKALFHREYAVSPMWWSPDSRFVAYVTWAGLLERFAMGPKYIPSVFEDLMNLDLGNGPMRLRVRRIDDGSYTPVFTIENGFTNYD